MTARTIPTGGACDFPGRPARAYAYTWIVAPAEFHLRIDVDAVAQSNQRFLAARLNCPADTPKAILLNDDPMTYLSTGS
jgi:hypothetical protein